MSQAACSRLWQAEAVLDGRLSAEDRASFERHAVTCSHCARERSELSHLKTLGSELPWPKAEPLQRRRQRNELLRKAHALSVDSPAKPAPARLRWVVAFGALCLLAAGWFAFAQRAGSLDVVASFDVQAAPGSAWRRLQGGPAVRLQLDRGTLEIAVGKLRLGQTFILELPDGQLEVRGTRFSVEAKGSHTERVAVTEGRVALRIIGRSELLLGAGESWQAAPPAPPAPNHAPVPSGETSKPVRIQPSAPAASTSVSIVAAPAPPATDFAEAMSSFTRGDFATAEQQFERFESLHPQSSQREDSLFLRALSRHRRGNHAGAEQLATEYLRRHPSGFRAADARRLLDAQ